MVGLKMSSVRVHATRSFACWTSGGRGIPLRSSSTREFTALPDKSHLIWRWPLSLKQRVLIPFITALFENIKCCIQIWLFIKKQNKKKTKPFSCIFIFRPTCVMSGVSLSKGGRDRTFNISLTSVSNYNTHFFNLLEAFLTTLYNY